MACMGRTRKNNPLGLPPHVYASHGAFYYVHRDGRWESLGRNLKAAIEEGRRRNEGSSYGSMRWWYAEFLLHCLGRIGKGKSERGLSQRTYDDYKDAQRYLDAFFGDMTPAGVLPAHVGEYLQEGADTGRPVRANREKAALSACFTWLMLQPAADVTMNPCIGVKRNPEQDRDRYVEDAEYKAVWKVASKSVRVMMDLVYLTLQRPEDVMGWCPANIATRDGQRIIRHQQGKTGHRIEIALSEQLEATIVGAGYDPAAPVVALRQPFVHRLDGHAYTYDGLCANLKHAQAKAKAASFGFQDLKAKGATDMYLSGVALELIRELCGHDSVTTTEIYVKRRMRKVVAPNALALPNIQ